MNIRKFQEQDRDSIIRLWERAFPDDPPRNEPSRVLEAKLAVDDLVFVAEVDGKIIGTCMAGYMRLQCRSGTGTNLVTHTCVTHWDRLFRCFAAK
jgi:predicted N-acetyltransferase YhbS